MKWLALGLALAAIPSLALSADSPPVSYPEARPFPSPNKARGEVEKAVLAALPVQARVILVFGANWCHDSRALAGWFATPRFVAMLRDRRYHVVWINVGDKPGQKDRNNVLARDFGLGPIRQTPTVLILDTSGEPVNLADAPKWSNSSTRSGDAIFDYFAKR